MNHLIKILTVLILSTFLITGCAYRNQQQQGTAVGAGVGAGLGAILGQAIGGSTEATLLGAGIGAALGGIAGNQTGKYMDQQEIELRNAIAASEAASIRREQDILTATLKGEAYFDFNSASVKPGGQAEMQRIASVLNRYPQTRIQLAGHTDYKGSEDYNLRLSQQRADAIKRIFVQQGINPQRIQSVGYGESQPISADDATNRRVEVIITPVTA